MLLERSQNPLLEERAMAEQSEEWDLWYPQGGATGIPFARGRIGQPAEVMLVHAAPQVLTVTVRAGGATVAEGEDLEATGDTPIARLTRRGGTIVREDIWPGDEDLGRLVILPGGEVGTLLKWWHRDDRGEWRWQLELYNRR
jgi:hypothetical protein